MPGEETGGIAFWAEGMYSGSNLASFRSVCLNIILVSVDILFDSSGLHFGNKGGYLEETSAQGSFIGRGCLRRA